eukprot:m.125376 g.125376  ORF g.125376 m.125376 type:complete len:181 (-) comp14671_c1_seq6:115-657(-)
MRGTRSCLFALAALLLRLIHATDIYFQIHEPKSISYVYRALASKKHGGIFTTPFYRHPLVLSDPSDACAPLRNAESVQGNLIFIKRGGCNFYDKCKHAQDARAAAVFVYDTDVNNGHAYIDMIVVNESGDTLPITIPVMFVLGSDGMHIAAALSSRRALVTIPLNETTVTLDGYTPWSIW